MAEFTYIITRNMEVFDPKTGETREVKAGDEVPEAARWRHLSAYLSDGTLIRQGNVEASKAAAQEEPVAEDEVEEIVEEVVEETPEEERFECPFCDKSYETEGWLDRHVSDKHVESDEDE